MKYRVLALLSLASSCLAAPALVRLPGIPVQFANTEYFGPAILPGLTGTRLCAAPGQRISGLTVEPTGELHGVFAEPGETRLLVYLVDASSSTCENPLVIYQLDFTVKPRQALAAGSDTIAIQQPQFIGSPYSGPRKIASIGADLEFRPASSSAATAGLSLAPDGTLSGVITGAPGAFMWNACLVPKGASAGTPCIRRVAVHLNLLPRPRWDRAILVSALSDSSAPAPALVAERADGDTGSAAEPTAAAEPAPAPQLPPAPAAPAPAAVTTTTTTNSSGAITQTTTPAMTTTTTTSSVETIDLGRVRYYFTGGMVLSNNGNSTSFSNTSAATFLALDVDRAWRLPKEGRNIGINTYFDARLTSVATQSANASSGNGSSTASLDTFLQSQKAATLQIGVYLPVRTSPWTLDRGQSDYSFFAAPLAKAGFVTQVDNTNAAATLPLTGRFFTQYSYGARLGVWKDSKSGQKYDQNTASEIVSYVDITAGRFGNFESYRDLTVERSGGTPASTDAYLIRRNYRFSFEGILKIPSTPIVLGFNANIGAQRYPGDPLPNGGGPDRSHPYSIVRDDLRFLIGARFDITTLADKLNPFKQTTTQTKQNVAGQ